MLDINGIAHIALSVKNIKKSKPFYKELLPFLGLKLIHDGDESCYHVGSRTGVLIQQINNQDSYLTQMQVLPFYTPYIASEPVSPVLILTTSSTDVINNFPSPIFPV